MLDPNFQALFEAAAAAAAPDAPPLESLPVEVVREWYRAERTAQNQSTAPADVATRDFTIPGPHGEIPVRLYTPADAAAVTGCLVYFHGGGWVIGDLTTHDGHCRRLAAFSGVKVLAVDYRLAPEHPFPAPYDDCLAATIWVFDHAAEIGVDPARVGVGGCSAGGNLAASVSISLRGDPVRRLALQMLLYPALTPAEPTESRRTLDGPVLTIGAMKWFEDTLAAEGHPDARRAAPAQEFDLSGLPPAFVATAGYDMLKDEGRDYADRLKAAGVKTDYVHYPALAHDFYSQGDISPAVIEAARTAAAAARAAL
jgi:acetyl esterase